MMASGISGLSMIISTLILVAVLGGSCLVLGFSDHSTSLISSDLSSSWWNSSKARAKGKHVYAMYIHEAEKGATIHGVSATMSVWTPLTMTGDMSIAQVWLLYESAGSRSKTETIEVGWEVEQRDGKRATRFFVFYTTDGYQRISCYNRECGGFVVKNTKPYEPGVEIENVSTKGGVRKEMNLTIVQEMSTKNWLLYADESLVGYWKASLFRGLTNVGATKVQWGGEVVWHIPPGTPTKTRMGSGFFGVTGPDEGISRNVAYFKNLGYMDKQLRRVRPEPTKVKRLVSYPQYYNLSTHLEIDDRGSAFFYYGGQGARGTT